MGRPSTLKFVHQPRVQCPEPNCRSKRIKVRRSRRFRDDGSAEQYAQCEDCKKYFHIILD